MTKSTDYLAVPAAATVFVVSIGMMKCMGTSPQRIAKMSGTAICFLAMMMTMMMAQAFQIGAANNSKGVRHGH